VQTAWLSLVGQELAVHSRPVSIRRSVLYVRTDEPGTSFGLSLLRVRLLERLPKILGAPITDVVVRAGRLE
jgi:hypothetical protein